MSPTKRSPTRRSPSTKRSSSKSRSPAKCASLSELNEYANTICSICQESLYFQNSQPVEIVQCNHKYHRQCLNTWCNSHNAINVASATCRCPYCNQQFMFKDDLKKIGTVIRNKIRGFSQECINEMKLDENIYDQNAIDEITNKINNMKRSGAGTRRSGSRSLSASSLSEQLRELTTIEKKMVSELTQIKNEGFVTCHMRYAFHEILRQRQYNVPRTEKTAVLSNIREWAQDNIDNIRTKNHTVLNKILGAFREVRSNPLNMMNNREVYTQRPTEDQLNRDGRCSYYEESRHNPHAVYYVYR